MLCDAASALETAEARLDALWRSKDCSVDLDSPAPISLRQTCRRSASPPPIGADKVGVVVEIGGKSVRIGFSVINALHLSTS
jgi:hypothetical protein